MTQRSKIVDLVTVTLPILLGFLCVTLFARYVMTAHPVSPTLMKEVRQGMPADAIETLLGTPSKVVGNDDGSEFWRYTGVTWCMVDVVFDEQHRVVELVHDH